MKKLNSMTSHANKSVSEVVEKGILDRKHKILNFRFLLFLTHIGTLGAWRNSKMTRENDIMTYYDARENNGAWAGLDFNERKQIRKIQYFPRMDDIYIYEGHEYELFYYTKNGWTSFGKQTATDNTLQYNIPSQALMYLYKKRQIMWSTFSNNSLINQVITWFSTVFDTDRQTVYSTLIQTGINSIIPRDIIFLYRACMTSCRKINHSINQIKPLCLCTRINK